MRVKIPRREIILFCSALLFPVASLCAQEVGQEVKEVRQDVEQLQQDVRELREEVRRLQEELHGFRRNSFPQCGMDTVAPYVPHRFIHRLGIELGRNTCSPPILSCKERTNGGSPSKVPLPLI